MDPATARGRRLMSSGTVTMLLVGSIALLGIYWYAPQGVPPQEPVAVLASVGLFDDDGGAAMFNANAMVPGKPVTRCLNVSYQGSSSAGTVYLAATAVKGRLARYLNVKVEQGTGGTSASCSGFTQSSVVYNGTLTNLVDPDPAAPRTSTGWSPSGNDSRTYRITATVADVSAARDRSSTATFRWFTTGAAPTTPAPTTPAPIKPTPTTPAPTTPAPTTPAPTTPAPTTPAPTTEPTTEAPTEPEPTPEASADPVPATDAPIEPVPTPEASTEPAPSTPAAGASSGAPAAVPGPKDRIDRLQAAPEGADRQADSPAVAAIKKSVEKVKQSVEKVRKTVVKISKDVSVVAVRTSSQSALPISAFVILLAFLVIQNRIDRLDPKLALAPVEDPHLVFTDSDRDDRQASDHVAKTTRAGVDP